MYDDLTDDLTEYHAALLSLGIDIGAAAIDVCAHFPNEATAHYHLSLTDPDWYQHLADLIAHVPPGAAIAALEPTGWHYAAPVIRMLDSMMVTILQVEHRTTKRVRESQVSQAKSDQVDARTLALIAADYTAGRRYLGVHELHPENQELATRMRALVRTHDRLTSRRTRLTNRLHQYAHSIWPALSNKLATYTRAALLGYVTPAQLCDLLDYLEIDPSYGGYNPSARNWLKRLVSELPDPEWLDWRTDEIDYLEDLIQMTARHIRETDQDIIEITAKIEQLLHSPPLLSTVTAWMSIPSASPLEIAILLAACGCTPELYTVDALKAAWRLNPSNSSSGKTSSGQRTEKGSTAAKTALHRWTMRLHKTEFLPNPVVDYIQRKKANGDAHSYQAGRSKLARILHALARDGVPCNW
ncbi:MAG: transposase [Anaerolineae bacterium]|nr:transposase [Anaerolineae bacterium]